MNEWIQTKLKYLAFEPLENVANSDNWLLVARASLKKKQKISKFKSFARKSNELNENDNLNRSCL